MTTAIAVRDKEPIHVLLLGPAVAGAAAGWLRAASVPE
jgi:hypothetical protein